MSYVELERLLGVTRHFSSRASGPDPHTLTEQTHLMSKCQFWVMEDYESHTGMWTLKHKDISLFLLLG